MDSPEFGGKMTVPLITTLKGIIEQFSLLYGPLFACLLVNVIAAILILLFLLWRAYKPQPVNQPFLDDLVK